VVLLAAFVAIAWASKAGSWLSGWDERVTDAFVAWRSPGWSRAFWTFTLLGESSTMAALAGSATVLLAAWGRRTHAAMMGGGMIVAIGVSEVAKAVVQRARPPETIALIHQPGSYSLPSGHALVSLVFWGLLVYVAFWWIDNRRARAAGAGNDARRGRYWSPALAVAAKWAVAVLGAMVVVMVSASRVYLGVHWTSDLFAGWCLGGAWLIVTPAIVIAVRRAGGRQSLLGDSGALGRRGVRLALLVALVPVVAVAAVLTAWANPLLV
jgi:undecaprenyl-diphosphatase